MAATFVGARMEIFVPLEGVIDLAEERKRIEKEIAKVDADLELLKKKLANPNFAQRAPPEMVEKDRARISELEQKRHKLTQGPGAPRAGGFCGRDQEIARAPGDGDHPRDRGVKIARAEGRGRPDQGDGGELDGVPLPKAPDPVVESSSKKLREGTKEGLSPTDHYDLGVAYMGMGLVDDAVREFNAAKKPAPKSRARPPKKAARKKAAGKKAVRKGPPPRKSPESRWPRKAAKKTPKKSRKPAARTAAKRPAKKPRGKR